MLESGGSRLACIVRDGKGNGVLRLVAFTVGRDSSREALVHLRYPLAYRRFTALRAWSCYPT